jgi:hypothetical protein
MGARGRRTCTERGVLHREPALEQRPWCVRRALLVPRPTRWLQARPPLSPHPSDPCTSPERGPSLIGPRMWRSMEAGPCPCAVVRLGLRPRPNYRQQRAAQGPPPGTPALHKKQGPTWRPSWQSSVLRSRRVSDCFRGCRPGFWDGGREPIFVPRFVLEIFPFCVATYHLPLLLPSLHTQAV